MSKFLTTASNEFEANIICGRLAEVDVHALVQGYAARGNIPGGGSRDIYVEDRDFDRAREALKAAEGVSNDDLDAMSEGPTQLTEPRAKDEHGEPHEPVEIPVPKRSMFDRRLKRAENPTANGEQRFRIGARVALGGGTTGEIVGTEILGEEPPPSDAPAIAAAAHNPGARVYVVRYEIEGKHLEIRLEADEITLAD